MLGLGAMRVRVRGVMATSGFDAGVIVHGERVAVAARAQVATVCVQAELRAEVCVIATFVHV